VWEYPTAKCKIDHAAAYPESLIEPCILSASNEGDWVLDPFSGTGTTGLVSVKLKRNFIGIEKVQKYNTYGERCGVKKIEEHSFVGTTEKHKRKSMIATPKKKNGTVPKKIKRSP
jgi:DNA modification methylase